MKIFSCLLLLVFFMTATSSQAQFAPRKAITAGIGYVTPKYNSINGNFDNTSNMGGWRPQVGFMLYYKLKDKSYFQLNSALSMFQEYYHNEKIFATTNQIQETQSYVLQQMLKLHYYSFHLDYQLLMSLHQNDKHRFTTALGFGTRYIFNVRFDSASFERITVNDVETFSRRREFSRKLKFEEKYYFANYVDIPVLAGFNYDTKGWGIKLMASYSLNNHIRFNKYDALKPQASSKRFFGVDFTYMYFINRKDDKAWQGI